MSKLQSAFLTLLHYFEEILCSALLVIMITLVIINVFLRYLFDYSIFWAEEVATICFVWCVFVGASATYKHKMDIGVDIIVASAPPALEKCLRILVNIVLLAINAYIFYMSIVFTHIAWGKPTAVLGVSSAALNSALIVAFGLITVYTLKFLYQDILVFLNKAPPRNTL
ncbi:TRAP transporter small permease [Ningiella sp. W23]|uniref:TRAP transporter small permease n=1 Tax=Ningiella sp. W23 TaxID=3023715 RepID=UPI003756545A